MALGTVFVAMNGHVDVVVWRAEVDVLACVEEVEACKAGVEIHVEVEPPGQPVTVKNRQ